MNDATNNPNSSLSDNSISKGQLPMSNLTNDNSSLSDTSNLQEPSALPNTAANNNALSNPPQNSRSTYFCALYTPLLSDFTNASRFAKQYSHRVRYVRDWGWFLLDGTRWHLDDSNQIFALASIQSYYDEDASLPKKSLECLWERLLEHAEAFFATSSATMPHTLPLSISSLLASLPCPSRPASPLVIAPRSPPLWRSSLSLAVKQHIDKNDQCGKQEKPHT